MIAVVPLVEFDVLEESAPPRTRVLDGDVDVAFLAALHAAPLVPEPLAHRMIEGMFQLPRTGVPFDQIEGSTVLGLHQMLQPHLAVPQQCNRRDLALILLTPLFGPGCFPDRFALLFERQSVIDHRHRRPPPVIACR